MGTSRYSHHAQAVFSKFEHLINVSPCDSRLTTKKSPCEPNRAQGQRMCNVQQYMEPGLSLDGYVTRQIMSGGTEEADE